MKIISRLIPVALLAAGCLLHSGIVAGDKIAKQPEKKKEQPAKDLVSKEDELANTDTKDTVFTQSFCKTYTLKMEKDKTYHIEVTSTAFPAHVRLESTDAKQIAADTSRFGVATVFHRPTKTEDHTIVATTQNGGAVGKFTLTVREVKDWDGKPVELKKNKDGEASHTGPLTKGDPLRAGKRHRVFLFDMEKGNAYQIDMVSKAFDSYLFLESPDGKQLAANDDGGGYPNARIVHTATESGKHRVVATYFGDGAGTFTLTIRPTDQK